MHLAVDHARQDMQALGIDGLPGRRLRQVANGGDLAGDDANVAHSLPVLIDQGAVFENEIERCGPWLPRRSDGAIARLASLSGPIKYEWAATQAGQSHGQGRKHLADRGIVKISGAEALDFLHRLVTNSLLDLKPGEARYAALLSGQGKLLYDFFVTPLPEGPQAGCLLDCLRTQIPDLVKKLNLHKLRAPVTIEDASESLAVAAIWGLPVPVDFSGVSFADPRAEGLGSRLIAPPAALAFATTPQIYYEEHRTALGVPKGGIDFAYGDTFVHDADLDG